MFAQIRRCVPRVSRDDPADLTIPIAFDVCSLCERGRADPTSIAERDGIVFPA